MKVTTTVELSPDVVQVLEQRAENAQERSELVEAALRAFFDRPTKADLEQDDLALLNQHADDLNAEAADVLDYQEEW